MAAYQNPLPGCVGEPNYISCCVLGQDIIEWEPYECINQFELCILSGYTAQRIDNWSGPYDSVDDCWKICGEL